MTNVLMDRRMEKRKNVGEERVEALGDFFFFFRPPSE